MNLKWAVVPGVLAAAACAVNQDETSAGRSSSRAEGDGTGAAMAPDGGANQQRVAAACVRTTRVPLFGGTGEATVTAINAAGHVVGSAPAPDGTRHAFFWNGRELIDLNPEGGFAYARGLNDRDEVIFDLAGRSFIWRDGQRTDIGGSAYKYTQAHAINEAGQVAGGVSAPEDPDNGASHAFLWEAGVLRDLGTFGYDTAVARFINDNGKILGEAKPLSSGPPAMTALFTWQNGVAATITRPNELLTAVDINAQGTVALRSAFSDGPPGRLPLEGRRVHCGNTVRRALGGTRRPQ